MANQTEKSVMDAQNDDDLSEELENDEGQHEGPHRCSCGWTLKNHNRLVK